MNILSDRKFRGGVRHVTVVLKPGETIAVRAADAKPPRVINTDRFYRLGEPMNEDVFSGHILAGMREVFWDSLEQKWLDAE